jgi:hypothetical protein
MLNSAPTPTAYEPLPAMKADEWRIAYRIALVNALVFLALAFGMFLLKPSSLAVILSAPALFSLGALLSFLLMVRSGGACSAIAWFVLGSGIFFGAGVVVGGAYINPVSAHSFSNAILSRDLVRSNLLNASSVFIVLAAAFFIVNLHAAKSLGQAIPSAGMARIMLKLFPLIMVVSAIAVGLKFVLFPIAENLVLRSVVSALYLSIPFCLFLLGMQWRSLGGHLRLIAGSVFFFEILNGLLNFNKLQIISALLALMIGAWVSRHTIRFVMMTLILAAAIFVIINPVVNGGRLYINHNAHLRYLAAAQGPVANSGLTQTDCSPTINSVASRFGLLVDVILGRPRTDGPDCAGVAVGPGRAGWIAGTVDAIDPQSAPISIKSGRAGWIAGTVDAGLKPALTRFSVPFIQGYLMDEYQNGRAGNSLKDFWAAMIPRVFWPGKPNITRFGSELYAQYYNQPPTSALAPTYSAEAYWNYGPIGVVLVSILLGLEFGWLTYRSQLAMAGRDPAFFLIAAPIALWAMQVEAWVVATYIGGFLIFFVIWLAAYIAFWCYRHAKLPMFARWSKKYST